MQILSEVQFIPSSTFDDIQPVKLQNHKEFSKYFTDYECDHQQLVWINEPHYSCVSRKNWNELCR